MVKIWCLSIHPASFALPLTFASIHMLFLSFSVKLECVHAFLCVLWIYMWCLCGGDVFFTLLCVLEPVSSNKTRNKNSIENFFCLPCAIENNKNEYMLRLQKSCLHTNNRYAHIRVHVHSAETAFKMRIRLMILQQNTLFFLLLKDIADTYSYNTHTDHMYAAIFVCKRTTHAQSRYFCAILSTNVININDIGWALSVKGRVVANTMNREIR